VIVDRKEYANNTGSNYWEFHQKEQKTIQNYRAPGICSFYVKISKPGTNIQIQTGPHCRSTRILGSFESETKKERSCARDKF
jgi:hypothetical protein